MSRIGKLPINIPEGITVDIDGSTLIVKGPKGTLERKFPEVVGFEKDANQIKVNLKKVGSKTKALYGTTRALLANMIKGVSEGWSKTLELVGTGFRAEVSGDTLFLSVGYSHPVKIKAPEGITFKVDKVNITVEGIDKELVGQVAANIRKVRPPEPYKGKGIKYKDEVIRRKAGKAAKALGGG